MDRETMELFLGRKIKVEVNNGWFYRGDFKIVQDGITIEDYKIGLKFISFNDIKGMEWWDER